MRLDSMKRNTLLAGAAALLGGCSGAQLVNALVPTATYRARSTVTYGPERRQQMDVYVPANPLPRTPVVVFFYGGSWTRGQKSDYRFVGEALASAGMVAIVADYRLSPQVHWTQILQDCASAVANARMRAREWGGAPDRLFLMGHSAGAYNTAMLALDPRWLGAHELTPADLCGWIGLAGPYDFLPISDADTRVAFDWPSTPQASQPIAHVTRGAPRSLLLAPRNDDTVDPVRNSAALAERLRRAGNSVDFALVDRVSHVTMVAALAAPLRLLAPVRRRVVEFVAPGLQPGNSTLSTT